LYQYVPESDEIGSHSNLLDGDALFTQSLLLLSDGLASGALLAQYELMYRKNPDLAITEARKPANAPKNRYRDISPCMLKVTKLRHFNMKNLFQMTAPGYLWSTRSQATTSTPTT